MKSSTRPRDSRLFPKHSHWIIFILTVIFRIRYVINKDNWWILHPDEIYQTLEVAHSELYGFGFRPYEYLPPPDLNDPNITIARKHEYHLGMYSLRSFIIPEIYSYVGIWKVFHTTVSSLLILSVYKFTTCMYGCHDTGVLSAFMCACSIHLNIMSTHTLINSFLSPFVYFIIADILERSSPKMLKTIQNNGNNSANNNNEYSSRLCGVKNVNMYNDAQFKQIPDQCKTDHNANLPNLLLTSKHDLESSNSTANMHLHTIAKNSSGRWSRMIKPVFSSFILGLVVYVRPDTCAVILSVIAFTINLKRLKFILCPFYLIGFILAISIGLRDDYVSYGSVIISPWQWIKFNVGGNLSSKLFGVEPTLFYVRRLLLDDWLNFLLFDYYQLSFSAVCSLYKSSFVK
ncbi:unnamed protein product [Mytilus edulis]|uniref:Mannosyltransferase n=1 Tax=Mytilus edulis TaxID=6550 RepID=A0A8S3RT60_MYTED|nr:unnamed protein product [Mytilus edulis]